MRLSPSNTAWIVCGLLVLAVFVVFGQTTDFEFVNCDDDQYVYDNPHVTQGLTAKNVAWAMTADAASNWHPLTWMSHMLDCQWYGLRPGGHHLTNVLLHAATSVLLFLVLWRMTGDLWPSAFVAAVFAIHPLRAESVAWVSERKDVLSGLFFMLTLAAYLRYVRRPFSLGRYGLVVAMFALGLMAKPMLVTLPFVLLLLDYWPLGRMTVAPPEDAAGHVKVDVAEKRSRKAKKKAKQVEAAAAPAPACSAKNVVAPQRVIVEKVPLLLLSLCSCWITSAVQVKAMSELDVLPLSTRVANAVVACAAYLGQFVWPTDLAALYLHPGMDLPAWKVVVALAVLATISVGALACWRRIPCLAVGWLWYLGMLVPVIGLVQVGRHAMADRYTYLPQIGLCIALAWGVQHVAGTWRYRRAVFGVSSALILAVLMGIASHQTAFWRDSQTLWGRALACTSNNSVAHLQFGAGLAIRGDIKGAAEHFQAALDIQPNYVKAHNNLGALLMKAGKVDEASEQFTAALRIKPDNADANSNLAAILTAGRRFDEAVQHYLKALAAEPNNSKDRCNLGVVLAQLGRMDEAIEELRRAVALAPNYAEAHANLGLALQSRGKGDEARVHFQTALTLAERENKRALSESMRAKLKRKD
jgi:tetratricopeptide (TPR) repeat protein